MAPKVTQIEIAADFRQALENIEQQLVQTSAGGSDLLAATVDCEPCNLRHWLSTIELLPRVYWRDRKDQLEIAGCGAAVTVRTDDAKYYDEAFTTIDRYLQNLPESVAARFLGGICYDPARVGDQEWSAFPSLWFVLPQLTFMREGDRYRLTLALDRRSDPGAENLRQLLASIQERCEPTATHQVHSTTAPGSGDDSPRREQWLALVEKAQAQMATGGLEKVVLARRTDLVLTQQLDPLEESLIRRLRMPQLGQLPAAQFPAVRCYQDPSRELR